MIKHNNSKDLKPKRVILLGGSGFVGKALQQHLKNQEVQAIAFSSKELDLCSDSAEKTLSGLLSPEDSMVILSALTPDKGRGIEPFLKNLSMMKTICNAVLASPCGHIVYFSSDAVYPLDTQPVQEDSPAAPQDLYGIMHRSREIMLKESIKIPFCFLRPTLIYGSGDSHNSYGPNRFRRQAQKEGRVMIGGEGEETRDHIYIDDVVELTTRVLFQKSEGILNLATGTSYTFRQVADRVAHPFDRPIEICPSPRVFPITHRSFDTTVCMKAFPDFRFTSLTEGIAKAHPSEERNDATV